MPSLNTGNAILSNPIKVDSSYNVGIGGAASGSFKLQVTGTTNLTDNLTMTIASGTKSIGFGGNTIAAAANALIYSDTNYLVLNSKAGSPLYLNFDNANASSTINMFNGKFILTQPGAATFTGNVTQNINDGTIGLYKADGTTPKAFLGNPDGSNTDEGYLELYKTSVSKVKIRANGNSYFNGGNVGIGTTTTTNGLLSLRANPGDTVALVFQPTGSQAPSAISNFLGTNQTFTLLGSNAYVTSDGNIARFNTSYAGCFIALDEGEISFGVGTNGANPGQKMRLASGGTLTINTPASGVAIIANGKTNEWTSELRGTNTTSVSFGLKILGGSNSSDAALLIKNAADNTDYLRVRGDGYLFSPPTYSLTTGSAANMNVQSDGTFCRSTASSQRFKENIIDWDGNGLSTILALKPKTFTYKDDYYSHPDRQFLGLIAEEVAEVSSYLADFENEDGTGQVENVRYANIVVPLIKAIQELNQTVQNQQQQINSLINR